MSLQLKTKAPYWCRVEDVCNGGLHSGEEEKEGLPSDPCQREDTSPQPDNNDSMGGQGINGVATPTVSFEDDADVAFSGGVKKVSINVLLATSA